MAYFTKITFTEAVTAVAVCSASAFVCWVTGSAEPLWALVILVFI